MTVSASSAKSGPYAGDGIEDTFDFDFYIGSEEELEVTNTDSGGTETVLTLNDDYTVDIGEDGTGSITLSEPLPEEELVTIVLNLEIDQQTDLLNLGPFFAETHEAALDKLTRICQQQQQILDRCLRITVSSDQDPLALEYDDYVKRPRLLDEVIATDWTTPVDLVSGSAFLHNYDFVEVEFGDVESKQGTSLMLLRLKGNGTWLTGANYYTLIEAIKDDGGPTELQYAGASLTASFFFPLASVWFQKAGYLGKAHGQIRLQSKSESGAQSLNSLFGTVTWRNNENDSCVSRFSCEYNGTQDISGIRIYNNVGGYKGNFRLWGMPKT